MDVTGVVVTSVCQICVGRKSIPGGERKYGELVTCPGCDGAGSTKITITIRELGALIQVERGREDHLWQNT